MPALPIILDVDTGVDDALALFFALRSPECHLVGVTTVHGNAPLSCTTANTLRILDAADGPEVVVVSGAAAPLRRPAATAEDVHGDDGLGGAAATLPSPSRAARNGAAAFLVDMARRFPGDLTLVATGPLTNLAQAVRKDPDALRGLKSIVAMGGAVRVPGNVGPVSEFNFYADPDAAAEVLGAELPLTLVPLDVTEQVVLGRTAVANARGKLASTIRRITETTMAFHETVEGIPGMFLHDPLALAVALDPSLVETEPLCLAVETRGAVTTGMVVADLRRRRPQRTNASVCVSVAADRFVHAFCDRVLQ